ncbi:hypothetical protein JXB28_00360 [Candidatus Woesearchaeota archaeon]|nr:hypothetical protein [Candidatus Woesearchaeota archaeon]
MELIPGVNVFTISQKLMLKKRVLAVITFTDGFQINLMYFGFDRLGLGHFIFSYADNPKQAHGFRAEEGGLFTAREYKYTFQVLHLSEEEAIIGPVF